MSDDTSATGSAGIDEWGAPLGGSPASADAWNRAWRQFLCFTGDPFATLAPANDVDDEFVMGQVFVATYLVLGATDLRGPVVRAAVDAARERVTPSGPEADHVEALERLVAGDFSASATAWDRIADQRRDFAAVRFAHDVYLHVGDATGRLRSSQSATERWPIDEPGGSYVAGQYAFALEEVGEFSQAERIGIAALEADPDDLWARHALAHVYESTDDQHAAIDLLEPSIDGWSRQDALATHIWWHLALRYLAAGEAGRVLDVYDRCLTDATTPFRLADVTSLLWRLELDGHGVGDRWDALADRWAVVEQLNTCAFIDLHAAMAFGRQTGHPRVAGWLDAVVAAGRGESSEHATVLREVGRPLVEAILAFASGDLAGCGATIDALDGQTHRIGGSIAQRDVIARTRQAAGAKP